MPSLKPNSMSDKHHKRWLAPTLLLLHTILTAHAIPQSVQEHGATTNVFENLETNTLPSATQAVDHFFDFSSSPSTSAPSLTLQRPLTTNELSSMWTAASPAFFKVIGHYSERFNNMDVDQMVSQAVTNDAMLQEQSARLPLDPDSIQRDLKPSTNEDSQAEDLRRQIRESINAEQSKSSADEIKGLRIALTYLVMAAVVVVVVFTRR